MYLRFQPLLRLYFGLLLAISIVLPANATVENIAPNTPIPPLTAKREQSQTTQQVMNVLLRGHYESRSLDDALSSRVLDIYLKDLDSTRSYFLGADIKEFEQYRYKLDEALSRGQLDPAFSIYNRFQQRVNERLSFLLNEINTNAAKYTYTDKETLDLDREDAIWAKSTAELDDLWRKRLKNSILSLRSAGKEDQASLELLRKRYQNQLNRIHQVKSEDAYQAFMNAVTRTFDPHTQYLSPRNTENFNINMSLSLQGIGAVLQAEDEFTKVVRLVPAGPASKAGNLHPADKIVGVGQAETSIEDVIGWRLDEVVDLIRGTKGSTVWLEIIPANGTGDESKKISIVRDEVKLEEQSAKKDIVTVTENGKTHKIGVIDIPTFYIDFQGRMENKPDYTSTTRDVSQLISELKEEGIEGLVIDLRNNGGGSLEEAINLTGLFIPLGPVVQVRSANGRVEVLPDRDPSVLFDGPLTVLVNRLSASASEIFAGAIQDYGRGLIVGSQTFGKGTVQSLQPLRSGQIKITQAKFYRISGDSTQNKGVIPDIEFPSLLDKSKIGESALDEAMPWDAIRPTQYFYNKTLSTELSTLRTLHNKRVVNNPDFLYLNKQRQFIDELQLQTQVSLNEKTRTKERKANDTKRLNLENERRKAKGIKLLASLEELEAADKENDALAEANGGDPDASPSPLKDKENDALLLESAHILLDLQRLNSATLAQQKP